MSDKGDLPGLMAIWRDIGANVQLLGIAGVCGALFKAVVAPEDAWKRRAVQGIAGVLSALFIGAFLGGIVDGFVSNPAYAYLASGFICGAGGEAAMTAVQHRILGTPPKKDK